MGIIELLFSLYTTDFTVPSQMEIDAAMKHAQECKAAKEPDDSCLNSYQKYLKTRDEMESGYVYYQ
ncbi:hypothetical protein [Sulfuriflexus mobilis]|uniref:hypothetical protein n=1 Tax=Sulfuriflexus mobilis TaxID=1811807 RepID=UPI000F8259BA|nr:hypothetical protein [Sulfuriflexus mobilis]